MIIEQKHIERFWVKVEKKSEDVCWNWMAGKHKGGYGRFRILKKEWSAHRFSWTLHSGEIPKGLLVCHTCDNPECVNPTHLFLGTQKDNIRDALRKGRIFKGEINGRSKLIAEQVLKIREEYRTGNITQRELAKKYNVGCVSIHNIVTRKTWRHI